MKYALKILLLIITLITTVVFIAAIYSIAIVDKKQLAQDIMIPIFFVITGLFSLFFHLKTLKLYKANISFKKLDIKFNAFWIINLVFGAGLIFMACFFIYLFYYRYEGLDRSQLSGVIYIIGIPMLLGIWALLDEAMLYRKVKKSKSEILIETIDDIKGNSED